MIDQTVNQIKEMETRSSSVVAVKAAEALLELLDREYRTVEEFEYDLERNSKVLKGANRSHAPLHTTQRWIVTAVTDANPETVDEAKAELQSVVDDAVTEVEASKEAAAIRAANLIEDGDTLLTHSNSSTATMALEYASQSGTEFTLYTTETRPNFFGRTTARQFASHENVEVKMIVDSAVGTVLPDCDRVIIGMNCIIENTIYNRVGTYPIAATAADVGVPVTVVGSSSKFIGDGFEFQQTYRSGNEVMLEPKEGFTVENPMYDCTPTRLLDQVVTEDGVMQF
ncbi:translation initiation factor eIF-2B [Natronoarchaeum sp. GCM10025703]|uniref:translation initiation factor eIF-2B n=1 Tax=unclassified Natronoarchaeum TaxID=2620183 RepID=UPI003618E2BF